jgi:error-prone DNA polymerase
MGPLPQIARTSPAVPVRGIVEKADGAINLRADRLTTLTVAVRAAFRDFR